MYVQATYFDGKDGKALLSSSLPFKQQFIVPGKVLAIYFNSAKIYFDLDKTTASIAKWALKIDLSESENQFVISSYTPSYTSDADHSVSDNFEPGNSASEFDDNVVDKEYDLQMDLQELEKTDASSNEYELQLSQGEEVILCHNKNQIFKATYDKVSRGVTLFMEKLLKKVMEGSW